MSHKRRRRDGEVNYEPLAMLTGRAPDPWSSFVQLVPYMVEAAREEAAENAASWRGFKVGGALLAIASYEHRHGAVFRANSKPRTYSSKVCSEKRLFGYAEKRGLDYPVGLVVVGKPNVDHGSGQKMPTLHPCEECRVLLTDKAQPDTLIMTVDLEEDKYQLMTRDELLAVHDPRKREHVPQEATQLHSDPGFLRWESSRNLYAQLINGWQVEIDGQLQRARTVADAARIAITGTFPYPSVD